MSGTVHNDGYQRSLPFLGVLVARILPGVRFANDRALVRSINETLTTSKQLILYGEYASLR